MTEKNYRHLSTRARQLMWFSYIALLLVLTLDTLVVPSCKRQPNGVIWLLNCVPLLAFLPALLKQNLRAGAWFCFLLLGYFALAVPVAVTCTATATVLEVAAIVVLFTATMLYIRWRSRSLKQFNQRQPHQSESGNNG